MPRTLAREPERDPAELVLTQLRIRESLRAVLEHEAKKNQISLNREIVRRLEESIEAGARLDLSSIRDDMMTAWLRFRDRFLGLELEEEILRAIEAGDLEAARSQVGLLRRKQTEAHRRKAASVTALARANLAAAGSLNVGATVQQPAGAKEAGE
jgi:hypothetical protein